MLLVFIGILAKFYSGNLQESYEALKSLSEEMDCGIKVQIRDEDICVYLRINSLEKGMDVSILSHPELLVIIRADRMF